MQPSPNISIIHIPTPAELLSLNEQLLNLKVLYDAAVTRDFSIETVNLISSQIKEVEKAIEARKEFLKG